ncbi:MAG: hypothetical protein JRF40_14370 [Deltaproteobacteria bacterium]|nr:hypothetical protein [Deltaproteobacteria bacterium]
MGYWGYPRYVSVAEKRAKAARKLKQLRKKKPDIKPIFLEGRAIARTWWGKSWNLNLERYADYSNRIGRGRSYVRHDAVLDLQIDPGKVESLVQGTRSKPYSVVIKIKAVNKMIWKDIKAACEGKLDSLQKLLAGKFPKALDGIFMAQGKGLFPSPQEIDFNCSCPDWAYMCKHVAATLYGIGARLDKDPSLFFKLRKAKMKDLVTQAVEDKTRKLLKKAKKKTTRVIDESDLADVFGIDIEEPVVVKEKRAKAPKRASRRKKSLLFASKTKARLATGKPGAKTLPKKASPKTRDRSLFDTVVGIIKRSRKGITVAGIREKTGLDDKQIRNIVYKAKNQGRIKNLKRGVYIPA